MQFSFSINYSDHSEKNSRLEMGKSGFREKIRRPFQSSKKVKYDRALD